MFEHLKISLLRQLFSLLLKGMLLLLEVCLERSLQKILFCLQTAEKDITMMMTILLHTSELIIQRNL